MPTVEQEIKVIVKAAQNGERRKFQIEVDAPNFLFQLSDILTAHGAEKSIDSVLRDRIREIIADHLKAEKTAIRRLAINRAGRRTPQFNPNFQSNHPPKKEPTCYSHTQCTESESRPGPSARRSRKNMFAAVCLSPVRTGKLSKILQTK